MTKTDDYTVSFLRIVSQRCKWRNRTAEPQICQHLRAMAFGKAWHQLREEWSPVIGNRSR